MEHTFVCGSFTTKNIIYITEWSDRSGSQNLFCHVSVLLTVDHS